MDRLVQIASFVYPWQAYIARGRLEARGIKAFVFDDGIVTAHPFISNAVGGVKLLVDRSDAERAIAILNEEEFDEELDREEPGHGEPDLGERGYKDWEPEDVDHEDLEDDEM